MDKHLDALKLFRVKHIFDRSIEAALDAAIAALSHAAGQEVDKPERGEATGDTTTFYDAWATLSPIDRAVITAYFERRWTAVARSEGEVDHKLLADLHLISTGELPDGDGVDTSVSLWAERWLSRLASSGIGGG